MGRRASIIAFQHSANYTGCRAARAGVGSAVLAGLCLPRAHGLRHGRDRTLNPQNPFAALGEAARIDGTDVTRRTFDETRDRTYRIAGNLTGTLFGNVTADLGVTAMHVDLHEDGKNYVYIQHFWM